ncbi:T9SS type A sorting domain-containing protein [Pontibacter sp. HSC-14F20]|uniref:Ig-like domain-containing protein n=1 Tax=Pontibacter sp. HSC-14F20 TaxID=2864136 RepID=UPI001C73204D|nr:T9SS type A sorting domain-containing protein [Pontibacter sp. HSC-14F20]MBX0334369.1 T9SS type A sorting domain-containing protein [Pontibacter sp. HSC-14F20]
MKHIYILIFALLFSSASAFGQSVILYGPNNFNDNTGISLPAPARGTVAITGSQLRAVGENGNQQSRGFEGYVVISARQFNLRAGYTYMVSFEARISSNNNNSPSSVAVVRGGSQASAGSGSSTPLNSVSVINTGTTLNLYTISFTVSQNIPNQFLALHVMDIESNNAELYIDDLSITEVCIAPNAPAVVNGSRCGAGTVNISATGVPAGGKYRLYGNSTGGNFLAESTNGTFVSPIIYSSTTYYISAVNANGCESARVPAAATINTGLIANTEFVKQSYEAGKPGIIKVNSDIIDRGHAVSIKWQSVNVITGVITELGVTEAPGASPASLPVASMPGGDTYFQATILPIASVCYHESSLFVTSQEIISLPVELVSFKGQSTNDGTQLNWKTASERDNKGFEVEVSADGKNFRKIAFVESRVGTTSLAQNYSFLDTKSAAGTNYYRLKQVDFDGAFEYSKTIVVNLTLASASTVYPTLATSDITVRLAPSDGQVTIAVADMAGKQLLAVQNPSERQVVLPVQQLQQGVYFVTVISGTGKEVFRFVKR